MVSPIRTICLDKRREMEKKLALTYVGNSQTTKRARTQLTEIDYVHPCKSLQFVLLPPEIIALPHAMETINRLAMTPKKLSLKRS